MIKASELRIGNIVWESSLFTPGPDDFEEIVVEAINDIDKVVLDNQNNIYSYDHLYPIPLTPEWLRRCGFAIETIPDSVDDEGDIIKGYTHWTNGKFCFHFSDGRVEGREHIQSMHLFQSWYYFSTGEELTIK